MSKLAESRSLCLVTGGAGFIGSHLVDHLLERGHPVRVLDNFATGRHENLSTQRDNPALEVIEGSILDTAAVEHALRGARLVFHLACLGVRHSLRFPIENHRVNAEGTLLLLEAVRRQGNIERFVHVSSSEIYGTSRTGMMDEEHPAFPHTVYGGSKLAGEAYSRAYHLSWGLPVIIVRPFNVFGPHSHYEGDAGELIPKSVLRALTGYPILVFGDGSQKRDFTYVGDTVRALFDIAHTEKLVGCTVNIGSGSAVSILEIVKRICELTPDTNAGIEHTDPRPGDVQCLLCDSGRLQEITGFAPRISLEDGLARVIDWFRDHRSELRQWFARESGKNWQ